MKSRDVWCSDMTSNTEVLDGNCTESTRPKDKKRCKHPPCEALWVAKDWAMVKLIEVSDNFEIYLS